MSKARVILLNPPTAQTSSQIILGLAYLGSYLRKAGHQVKIIDAAAKRRPHTKKDIEKIIKDYQPHFIGVTLLITNIPQTYQYIKELKKTGVGIVVGGPHANSLPEEVLMNGADMVCIGEGEKTILDIADYFLGNISLSSINGICFLNKDNLPTYTRPRDLIGDLDSIPFPDFHDFPIRNYTGSDDVDSNLIFWSIFTSRGCPFNCTFCSSHNVFGRRLRMRSAVNIFNEIKALVEEFGVKRITFQDDEILCSKPRFLELCNLLISSMIDIKMSIRTRIDSIDREVIVRAKAAGLSRISFGIESLSDETLRKINKKYTLKTIHEKFKVLEEANFPHISFNNICGFPWETRRHFRDCILEAKKIPNRLKFHAVVVTPIPYPHTELYERYKNEFNFKNWWLENRDCLDAASKWHPFFLSFAFSFYPLYTRCRYWNYSDRKKTEINSFCWRLLAIMLNRHYSFPINLFILASCRLSYFLWRISPSLEKISFTIFSQQWRERTSRRVVFTDK